MRIPLLIITSLLAALPAHAATVPDLGSDLSQLVSPSHEGKQVAALNPKGDTPSLPSTGMTIDAVQDRGLDAAIVDDQVRREMDEDSADFDLKLPDHDLPDSDIPLTVNDKVEYFIYYFQTSARHAFTKWLSRSERYIPMMKQVLKQEGLPEDLVYLAMIESGFSPHAYSVARAVGPWQFMSGTGKRYSLRIDRWIDERRDPLKSTVAAALYLKELYSLFNNDWYLAAAGYNAGENKILRAIDMYNSHDFWQLAKGSYLKRETKDYVPKLLAAAIIAKDPARYGFADVAYLPAAEFDTVAIPSRTDLDLVAKLCNVSVNTIHALNPELRRWCTPPNYPGYLLKIPYGTKPTFETAYDRIPEDQRFHERVVYARYRARRKDSLAAIARRYGTTPRLLAKLNHISTRSRVRGKSLIVPLPTEAADNDTPRTVARKRDTGTFTKYYTVKRGDTLASLARRFNVSSRILSIWNNLKGRLALRPGKRIIVAKYVDKKGSLVAADENS